MIPTRLTDADRLQPHTTIATIGMFDGFHTGHRHIAEELYARGYQNDRQPLLVTFDQHPQFVLGSKAGDPFRSIQPNRQRLDDIQLYFSGFTEPVFLLVLPFTKQFARQTAREFLTFLRDKYGVDILLMGYNQHFGSDGKNINFQELGHELGIRVCIEKEETENNEKVSSSIIRQLIRNGNITKTNELMMSTYTIEGVVVHGFGTGRKLGFPTANVGHIDPQQILPRFGVYAVQVEIPEYDDEIYEGMANVGVRPTLGGTTDVSVEVNIFDFDQDIYGKKITVSFFEFLREETQFDNLEQLSRQLSADKENARQWFTLPF